MLEALKSSNESKELVDAAMKYLRGVKGTLVQQKKRDREKAAATAQNGGVPPPAPPAMPRVPTNNTGKYVHYGSSAGAPAPQVPTGNQIAYSNAPPQRELPWYHPSSKIPQPLHLRQTAPDPQQGPSQVEGDDQYQGQNVAAALRGFLGH
jgi:hypothetical protein